MNKNRVIFVIPGFRHSPKQKAYQAISRILRKEGFSPKLIRVKWSETISENTEAFLETFSSMDAKEKYVLGFSFGAMIAFLAATKVDVDGLVLCSLSPYFQEDIVLLKKQKLSIQMQRRQNDFLSLRFQSLVKKVRSNKVLMLYGEKEASSLVRRVVETFGLVQSGQKSLIQIPKTDHEIGSKRYLSTIHKVALFLQ